MKVTITEKDLNKATQLCHARKRPKGVTLVTDCLFATALKRTKNPEELSVGVYKLWMDGVKYYLPKEATELIELWIGEHVDVDRMKAQHQAVLVQLPISFELTSEFDI